MKRERRSKVSGAVAVTALALVSSAVLVRGTAVEARARFEDRHEARVVEHWHDGDIRRFHEADLGRWRGGRWFHGDHIGRLGWWWIVDGVWYAYPMPVYPYPDPYVPSTVVTQPPAPAVQPYWYYCASVKQFYPYVASCPESWMQVAPQPTPPGS